MANLDRAGLARMIDHTLLRPEATPVEVTALCVEASRWGVAAVCIAPSFLPLGPGSLASGTRLAVVVGFPSGAHHARVKAHEAELAVEQGAAEVDVVASLGDIRASRWVAVEQELAQVRRAIGDAVLKVILETALWDAAAITRACLVAEAAGADFVKTSTGFHPAGGASVGAVATMHAAVGGRLGIKASGGIRTLDAAVALVGAGATRLGMSATGAVLAELDAAS
jgi:deoxyribose-phosphate aldolase